MVTGVQSGGYRSPNRLGETIDVSPEDAERLELADGEVFGTTGGNPLGFTLRVATPEAEVTLTGTTFAVFRTPDATCFCLWNGSVDIRTAAGDPATLAVVTCTTGGAQDRGAVQQTLYSRQQGGQAQGARWFHDQLHAVEEKSNRLHDGRFGNRGHIVDVFQHQRKGNLAQRHGAGAVGDGGGILHPLQGSRPE